jgi:DNA polymerase-3 subunit epsilon
MQLNLTRPLAFIDLETTGVNVSSDRIVEISILKIMPDGTEQVLTKRINPEMPIPIGSSKVHGIYDKDITNEATFNQLAKEFARFIDNSDIGGYNSNKFDIPLLVEEFLRAGIDFDIEGRRLVDVQNIFHKMEQRTLVAAYKFYCNKEMENAHSAEADIKATYQVLLAQLERYEALENDVNFLHEFCSKNKNADLAARIVFNENNIEVFSFGKHKDKAVVEVFQKEPSYYDWMMKGDFTLNTKKVITAIRLKAFNSK